MPDESLHLDEFTDSKGNVFRVDPTGAARFRLFRGEKTSRMWAGTWGDKVTDGPGLPVRTDDYVLSKWKVRHAAKTESEESVARLRAAGGDSVANLLLGLGWLTVIASVAVGLVIVAASGGSSPDAASAEWGWLILIGGSLQGLMIVGFARAINFMAQTAANSAATVALLKEAVRERD